MISPLNMLQEQQIGKPHAPWRILVCCQLLNMTHGRQVRPMIEQLFTEWWDPQRLGHIDEDGREDLIDLIRPLGFANRRSGSLIKMSYEYNILWANEGHEFWRKKPNGNWASHLPGCGPYAVDSLNVFLYDKLDYVGSDTWINKYVEWRRTNYGAFEAERFANSIGTTSEKLCEPNSIYDDLPFVSLPNGKLVCLPKDSS